MAMTPEQAEKVLRRACDGKNAYGPKTARQVAQVFTQTNPADEPPVHKYRCPVCGRWHVGHVPDMANLASIAEAMRVAQGYSPGEKIERPTRAERRRARKVKHAAP